MKIIFISVLLATMLFFSVPIVYAQTTTVIILAEEDSTVDEDYPDSTQISTTNPDYPWKELGEWIFLISGMTNTKDFDSDALVRTNAYIKFDVSEIPKTDTFQIVDIDAKLRLLVQEIDGSKRTLITVQSCKDDFWNQKTITWDNRPCKDPETLRGEDSILIEKSELPATFSWDVSRSIYDARNKNLDYVTLVISTMPLKQVENLSHTADFTSALGTSQAWIWSIELEEFGANAAPTLYVTYSVSNSNLMNVIDFALVALIPAIAIVIPAAIWLVQRKKNPA